MAMKPRRNTTADFSTMPLGFPLKVGAALPSWRELEDAAPSPCNADKWKSFMKTVNEEGILTFYSRSACGVQKYLSNFQETPRPLRFLGKRFRTVEHAFQASKWLYARRGPRKDMFAALAIGGKWGDLPGKKAKGKGGKGAFGKQKPKEELDVDLWNEQHVALTQAILKARAAVDPLFRNILARARADGVMPVHFVSMRGAKSQVLPFWGVKSINKKNPGYLKGRNMLGKLMMYSL